MSTTAALDTYFLVRCRTCQTAARVASRHAGLSVACPACGAATPARPEPVGDAQDTSRVAYPIDSSTTARHRRAMAVAVPPTSATQQAAIETISIPPAANIATATTSKRKAPRGMTDFALDVDAPRISLTPKPKPQQPAGSSSPTPAAGVPIERPTKPHQHDGHEHLHSHQTHSHSTLATQPPSWIVPVLIASVVAVAIGVWGLTDASGSARSLRSTLTERNEARDQLSTARTRIDDLDRRLAQAEVQLVATKAAAERDRELANTLTVTNARLVDELSKASAALAQSATTLPAATPLPAAQQKNP